MWLSILTVARLIIGDAAVIGSEANPRGAQQLANPTAAASIMTVQHDRNRSSPFDNFAASVADQCPGVRRAA